MKKIKKMERVMDICFDESSGGALRIGSGMRRLSEADKVKNILKPDVYPVLISGNITVLPFYLDQGDISDDELAWKKRKPYMYNTRDKDKAQFDEEVDSFMDWVKSGGNIRIWYSEGAAERCGLAFVCSVVSELGNENTVSVIKLPEYVMKGETMLMYRSWGEVNPETIYDFLELEERLSSLAVQHYAREWEKLKKENSLLRAVVNGQLVSVPEDFYDFLLDKYIPEGEFVQIELLAGTLEEQIPISDIWLGRRIDKMIAGGLLEVVRIPEDEDPEDIRIWRRTLRKKHI